MGVRRESVCYEVDEAVVFQDTDNYYRKDKWWYPRVITAKSKGCNDEYIVMSIKDERQFQIHASSLRRSRASYPITREVEVKTKAEALWKPYGKWFPCEIKAVVKTKTRSGDQYHRYKVTFPDDKNDVEHEKCGSTIRPAAKVGDHVTLCNLVEEGYVMYNGEKGKLTEYKDGRWYLTLDDNGKTVGVTPSNLLLDAQSAHGFSGFSGFSFELHN